MIDGRIVEGAFWGIAFLAFMAGCLVTATMYVGFPMLWDWLKPMIHAWTA